MKPSAEVAATMDAWTAGFEEPSPRRQAVDSMNQAETTDPSPSMNVNHAALRSLINAEVEC